MNAEQALQEADRHAALDELYAMLAEEAYQSDPDLPFEPTDRSYGEASTDIGGR